MEQLERTIKLKGAIWVGLGSALGMGLGAQSASIKRS